MYRTGEISRRALLGLLCAVPGSLRGALPAVDRLLENHQDQGKRSLRRRYRASASILFCGMTVFSRRDVGGGYAVAEESVEGDLTTIALQFAGGSWPEKAHGINRLGFIQEVVVEKSSGDPVDAAYFGFMTSSTEKSFEQAKKALDEHAGSTVPYTATQGWADGGRFSCSLYHLLMPSRLTFSDCPQLIRHVRATVAASDPPSEKRDIETSNIPRTFLNSIREALLSRAIRTECDLIYNSKQYYMTTTKNVDGANMRLNGTLQERGSDRRTPFQLWFKRDGKSFLPVRIEYRARPFLRLVFEECA
ncbi:MAG: hypothetical protein JWO80_3136 [Bryobacterales bacterium]|nr:hypothetical protein [Bryobacterales bacterium]